jgi:hypothetical protein
VRPSVVCRLRPPTTVHECCDQLAHFLTFVLQRVEQRARNRMMCFAPRDQPVFDLQVPFGPTIADWAYGEKIAPMTIELHTVKIFGLNLVYASIRT